MQQDAQLVSELYWEIINANVSLSDEQKSMAKQAMESGDMEQLRALKKELEI